MNPRQRSFLVNLNRAVIFALTLTGLLMDGYQASDLLCTSALIVWLWLPQCTRLEANILRRVDSKRNQFLLAKQAALFSSFHQE